MLEKKQVLVDGLLRIAAAGFIQGEGSQGLSISVASEEASVPSVSQV